MATQNGQTEHGGTTKKTNSVFIALILVFIIAVAGVLIYLNQDKKDAVAPKPSQDNASLNVGIQINDSPGFSELNDGQRTGFDIDVANYVVNGMGKHANFIPITVGSRDQQLKEGFVDMVVSTYSITDAHISNGIIFAGPYIRTDQGIMTTKDASAIHSIDDLSGETVCVTTGSTSATKLEELKNNVPFTITYRDTLVQCIEDMKNPSNNVAAVTSDAVILQGHAHADDTLKYVSGITVPGSYEKYGIGISKKNPELCKQAAKLLKNFISDQWNSAFTANIQSNTSAARSLKPDLNSIDSESCKTNPQ